MAYTGWQPICQNEIPGGIHFFPGDTKIENIPETVHIEENIEE